MPDSETPLRQHHRIQVNEIKLQEMPGRIYSPLGLGEHPDHLLVRDFAITLWRHFNHRPKVIFYEDLPYAYLLSNADQSRAACVDKISQEMDRDLLPVYGILDSEMKSKLRFSRLYFTQMDKSSLSNLALYARRIGKECQKEFAERYFETV
jgi:hypothetical protein